MEGITDLNSTLNEMLDWEALPRVTSNSDT